MYVVYAVHWNWNQQKQSIEYTRFKYDMIDLCTNTYAYLHTYMHENMYLCTYVSLSRVRPRAAARTISAQSPARTHLTRGQFETLISCQRVPTHIVQSFSLSSDVASATKPALRSAESETNENENNNKTSLQSLLIVEVETGKNCNKTAHISQIAFELRSAKHTLKN